MQVKFILAIFYSTQNIQNTTISGCNLHAHQRAVAASAQSWQHSAPVSAALLPPARYVCPAGGYRPGPRRRAPRPGTPRPGPALPSGRTTPGRVGARGQRKTEADPGRCRGCSGPAPPRPAPAARCRRLPEALLSPLPREAPFAPLHTHLPPGPSPLPLSSPLAPACRSGSSCRGRTAPSPRRQHRLTTRDRDARPFPQELSRKRQGFLNAVPARTHTSREASRPRRAQREN